MGQRAHNHIPPSRSRRGHVSAIEPTTNKKNKNGFRRCSECGRTLHAPEEKFMSRCKKCDS